MEADDLIRQTKAELGIPGDGADPHGEGALRETAEWRELDRAVRSLRESADAVGVKPVGYPLPVDLVMRAVQALLPWYTRPLRRHAEDTVAASIAVQALMERIVSRQDAIEERLSRVEAGSGEDA